MTIRIGINGFGRIGRCIFRIAMEQPNIQIVAVNDLGDTKTLAHLLKFDSAHGNLSADLRVEGDWMWANEEKIKMLRKSEPDELLWGELGVDVVIEATGRFRKFEEAKQHINTGASKVVVTAPLKGGGKTIVMGVNEQEYDPEVDHVVSCASCTTNCLAPIAKVLGEHFGIVSSMVSTVHAYTNDQRLLDSAHTDLRRARAAALSIVPTTTGAAKAIGLVLPEHQGHFEGISFRVPVPVVSLLDAVFQVQTPATPAEVNSVLRTAAQTPPLQGILDYIESPVVSCDIIGNPYSSIVDGLLTMAVGQLVKVVSWYDNEWGYAQRVVDMADYINR